MLCTVAFLAMFALVQGRAVNISNTWVLPEEGFPVFYRYFRDRISWYEADAVCQFHHANLVTESTNDVAIPQGININESRIKFRRLNLQARQIDPIAPDVDTTAQYDAVRAYLKELDISSAVWVGLIRSNPDGDFTWTDYRGLSGDGYWSSAPDGSTAPLCAAANPAADYRWEARACGGPTVASFICELPVPQWALGNEGCMVRALPALTILYLPESAAVQLTADCGLAGVKRVQCTGNVKREELLRDLSCAQEEDSSSTANLLSTSTIWPITTDGIFTDEDSNKEASTEENITTEHEDDINQPNSMTKTSISPDISTFYNFPTKLTNSNKFNKVILEKSTNLYINPNNNLQSNYIPKIASEENMLSNAQLEKLEDEKHMQHKMIHEEIARLGNLDNIFTQPTDHFVPPLVMAKAKISDDMIVLSLAEKHAQKLAEQQFTKNSNEMKEPDYQNSDYFKQTTNGLKKESSPEPQATSTATVIYKDNMKKDIHKYTVPKKYHDKLNDPKAKFFKTMDLKLASTPRTTDTYSTSTSTENIIKENEITTIKNIQQQNNNKQADEGPSIDLTVLIKDDMEKEDERIFFANFTGDVPKLESIRNSTLTYFNINQETTTEKINPTVSATTENIPLSSKDVKNITLDPEIIKINIDKDDSSFITPTVLEVATMIPIFHNDTYNSTSPISQTSLNYNITGENTIKPVQNVKVSDIYNNNSETKTTEASITTAKVNFTIFNMAKELQQTTLGHSESTSSTIPPMTTIVSQDTTRDESDDATTVMKDTNNVKEKIDDFNGTTHEGYENNSTEFTDGIDDFQSPLLSGANEPIARPNRSRRPQTPNRNKFNPFRILG